MSALFIYANSSVSGVTFRFLSKNGQGVNLMVIRKCFKAGEGKGWLKFSISIEPLITNISLYFLLVAQLFTYSCLWKVT